MEAPELLQHQHKKTLHGKRTLAGGKHISSFDSPAYDASEEDNDPFTDDGASTMSIPVSRNAQIPTSPLVPARTNNGPSGRGSRVRQQHLAGVSSDDGVDSPTYDGDIESSNTAGLDLGSSKTSPTVGIAGLGGQAFESTSTLTSPVSSSFPEDLSSNVSVLGDGVAYPRSNVNVHSHGQQQGGSNVVDTNTVTLVVPEEPSPVPATAAEFDPAALTLEDVQAYVRRVIEGESHRKYKVNKAPVGRPVRIYADGVYDLFHFGHALQLRQAKFSFPSVHLLVGVNSDEQVHQHKARTVMSHSERCEAVRHCRWVDQVIPEAPWVIGPEFLAKYEIDYVAHDEDPYVSAGHEDIYSYCKSVGKFIPTRRTPGVSTSELLERIVLGYRKKDFDPKLEKLGRSDLKAEGSDFDDSPSGSRTASRVRGRKGITPARS